MGTKLFLFAALLVQMKMCVKPWFQKIRFAFLHCLNAHVYSTGAHAHVCMWRAHVCVCVCVCVIQPVPVFVFLMAHNCHASPVKWMCKTTWTDDSNVLSVLYPEK